MRLLKGRQLILALLILTPVAALFGILIGPTNIALSGLLSRNLTPEELLILREIRLPRVLLTALVGCVLATSGAVLQGLFRNPMADPSLIGITAGASVGASFAILISASLVASTFSGLSLTAFGAFVGGGLTVWLVYSLSTGPRGTSVTTMLLVGIAINALAAALNNLMNFLADNEMLRRMSLWQMGNLDLASWDKVALCSIMLVVFVLLLRGQAQRLNVLLLGESEARHLGIDVAAMKKRLVFLTALGVGICTAIAGTIAFVGLIVPHIVRVIVGPDHRMLLPATGLLGAMLLVLADLLARIVLAPAELPVGVITAFLGVPFFIYLLVRQRRVDA